MPLSVNVGLSRKASRNYQSAGVSINVTAELDQSLLARPEALQQEVAHLYSQARQAMERQAPEPLWPLPSRSNGQLRENGHVSRNGGHADGGGMTESQRRAILAIARRLGMDANYEAEQVIGAPLDQLIVRQASELIDHLKSLLPANGTDR